MKKIPVSYRQGDVLLVDAAYRGDMPDCATPIAADERGRVVLAYGEVTGHAHVIDSEKAAYFDSAGERFIQMLSEDAPQTHEEHGTILLNRAALVNPANGRLQQAFQVEEQGEEVRRVED